jgi:putative hydrolase of the HAD superfamily
MNNSMLSIDRIQLITFDLDDTLYPEMDYVAGGLRNVADVLAKGNTRLSDLLYKKMIDRHTAGRRDIFQTVLADLGETVSEDAIRGLIDIYRTSDRKLTLFTDADRAMDRLRAAGVKMAILTDGWLEAQRKKVEWLKLADRMDAIFYTDALGKDFWKPCPKGFEDLMKRFNLSPAQCVYIADNELKDFVGPKSLGWRTVKIVREQGIYRNKTVENDIYKSEFSVNSLDDLIINNKSNKE